MTRKATGIDSVRAANNQVVHREGEERQARYQAELAAANAEKRERRRQEREARRHG